MNPVSDLRHMLSTTPLAIQPEYIRSMISTVSMVASNAAFAEHHFAVVKEAKEIAAARRQQISASTGGAVAVLPLYGVISQRSSWMSYFFGGTSTETFTQQFRQALADPNVTSIVMDVDSPGGSVSGVDELAAEVFAARGKKSIVAISNTLNASAAYYISCSASKLYVMPSSLTGSIGVYSAHEDDSGYLEKLGIKITLISAGKYKVEGNSYEPLGDDARASEQAMVDGYYKLFAKAVAKGRGVKVDAVVNGFGQGRVLMASDAVSTGMADDIGTLDSVLAKFGVKRPVEGGASFATGVEAPTAAVEGADLVPEAAKPAKADEIDDNDDGSDDDQDADDNPCACTCASCLDDKDCASCTVKDCDAAGCTCPASQGTDAKAAADERERLLALQGQQIYIALNV